MKDAELPESGELALPVAPTCGLSKRVHPPESSINDREVDIDAGLDELGGNQANRLSTLLARLDLGKDPAPVLRAHQRGKMDGLLVSKPLVEHLGEGAGVRAEVDDGEDIALLGDLRRELLIARRLRRRGPSRLHPAEALEGPDVRREDLAHGREPVGKPGALPERRLRRGADHDRHAEVADERAQPVEDGCEQRSGQRLRLIEDDHAPREAVELAARGRAIGEEALQELHRGRHHDGGIPVLGGDPVPVRLLRRIEGAMMLEDCV
jgi:hypothetical protein